MNTDQARLAERDGGCFLSEWVSGCLKSCERRIANMNELTMDRIREACKMLLKRHQVFRERHQKIGLDSRSSDDESWYEENMA